MSNHNIPSSSRPPSSLSRPSSSASHRTISRLSAHRPTSRVSQRPSTRQSARVSQQIHDLITQVTGYNSTANSDEYAEALEIVSKRIDAISKQAVGIDLKTARDSKQAKTSANLNWLKLPMRSVFIWFELWPQIVSVSGSRS